MFYVSIFKSLFFPQTFKAYFKITCTLLFQHLKALGCLCLTLLLSALFACALIILYSSFWQVLIYGNSEESWLREMFL